AWRHGSLKEKARAACSGADGFLAAGRIFAISLDGYFIKELEYHGSLITFLVGLRPARHRRHPVRRGRAADARHHSPEPDRPLFGIRAGERRHIDLRRVEKPLR